MFKQKPLTVEKYKSLLIIPVLVAILLTLFSWAAYYFDQQIVKILFEAVALASAPFLFGMSLTGFVFLANFCVNLFIECFIERRTTNLIPLFLKVHIIGMGWWTHPLITLIIFYICAIVSGDYNTFTALSYTPPSQSELTLSNPLYLIALAFIAVFLASGCYYLFRMLNGNIKNLYAV